MTVYISIAGETRTKRVMLGLGHVIFTICHVAALYFDTSYLLITIPVHLIYAAVALANLDSSVPRPNPRH